MKLPLAIALVLASAVLLASLRMAWHWWRAADGVRPQAWRMLFLLLAQAVGAALLWFALFPPATPLASETLVVLTADAGRVEVEGGIDGRVVALPEAAALPLALRGAERVPDLATVLRRHPEVARLHVVGAGLVARDRPAAEALPVRFSPAPLPAGLLALHPPTDVGTGRSFQLPGRTRGLAGGSAELLDPSGARIARATIEDGGGFLLDGKVFYAGRARFRLRLRDDEARLVEETDVVVEVLPAPPLRALALAAAPNAELKFLRRWANDAGIDMQARIELGGGLQVGDAPASLAAATLDRTDLLVVDERRWQALGGGQRAAVLSAVERGLGLLLRLSGSADGGDRRMLRALGFEADATPRRDTRLGAGFVRPGDAADALPMMTRSPVALGGSDALVALRDAAGRPLAAWRTRGRGRIGVAAFDDSYRLALAGRSDAHGEAWSRLFSTIARARDREPAPTVAAALPGNRSIACGLGDAAEVRDPDGRRTSLHVDPRSGAARCAGFWAHGPGWHVLRTGERDTRFFVPDEDERPAMRARDLREATLALAHVSDARMPAARATAPGPRWPWFIGWLLLTAAMWWLERSRRGLRVVGTEPTTTGG